MINALHGHRVLLIEPDRDILEILTLVLQQEGINVLGFRVLPLLLDSLLDQFPIDLAILEFQGKGEPAINAMRLIKIRHLVPVIAMSCDLDIEQKSKIHGFEGYIPKPFDIDDLLAIITKLS